MNKSEFLNRVTEAPKDKLVSYMLDTGDYLDFEIMTTEDFVQHMLDTGNLYGLGRVVKDAGLDLTHDLIRVETYYKDYKEADTVEELVTSEEALDYFEGLADGIEESGDPKVDYDALLIEAEI